MNPTIKQVPLYFSTILLGVGIYLIGYQIPRENFSILISVFSLSFFGLYILQKSELDEKTLFSIGVAFRLLLILSVPVLSDDYFRFLWDGLLIHEGFNPFEYQPAELITNFKDSKIHNELFAGMNSPNYYSIYPPINQWIFYIASLPKSVFGGIVIIRLFIVAAEIATYSTIKKILQRYNLNQNRIWWYWLNPLVILELTGNLHGEGILTLFLLLALYHFVKLKDLNGGLLLGLSVLSKLFSLIFFPVLLLKARWFRSKKILLGAIPIIVIAFLPFLNWTNANHFLQSLDLYFQSFEFNGSIFNIVRWAGYKAFNFNIIKTAGPILSIIAFLLILLISWLFRFRNRLAIFKALTLMFCVYLFLSPIVHPWYCILPLTLSLFTNMKFMIAWSATIFLSYIMYDSSLSRNTKTTILFIEYIVVFAVLMNDLKKSFSFQKIKTAIQV
jgi:hypothetical protein